MSQQYIVFSHGQDGEPWGTKIVAMAEVAKKHGLTVESVDYRGMADPAARVAKFLEVCKKLPGELLLVAGALFCTVLGYFGLQPMMEAAKAGEPVRLGFGALHGLSTLFFAVKGLLLLALAWRQAGR